jgi:hypothetical protein
MVISTNGVKIHKPNNRHNPVKLYANVPSRSRPGKFHTVTYIRKPGVTERWFCTCEDQVFVRTSKRQHCDHIKKVKSTGEMLPNGRPVLVTFA